jgi:tetratricopeptide (TPR) repeat protein
MVLGFHARVVEEVRAAVKVTIVLALMLIALPVPGTGLAQRAADFSHEVVLGARQIAERGRRIHESVASDRPNNARRTEQGDLSLDELRRLVEAQQHEIQAIEQQDGPNSAVLIEPLTALGAIYQEGGLYFEAIATLQRALGIVRIHDGLHSLEQAPLLRRLIDNAKAVGDAESAWNFEQESLQLVERHPDDPRTARILREAGDTRVDILSRYNAGEFPLEIILGCYYEPAETSFEARLTEARRSRRDCLSGSRRHVRRRLIAEARNFYARSADVILRNERYSNDELPALLMELLYSSYQYENAPLGKKSLNHLLAYQVENSEPLLDQLDTLVQIADWDLITAPNRKGAQLALDGYAEAYELLVESGLPQPSIDRIFWPETPVVLPAFLDNPLASEGPQGASGHIDVAFEITEDGRSRRVEVLDTTQNSSRAAERRLVELILHSRFRPRSRDGQFAAASRVVVRYYLKE